ncbi:MAG TPA: hypothetical protein P5081_12815 [Phycisphaerae bacterium]|nr:hypothetical protein [Phycisphaerae bacterium]HRW53759.1 hypothetical protein [Phycisphaerae bacterium]
MINLSFILILIAVIVGLQFVVEGLRGRRIGDMRVCNQCGYILVEGEAAARCSECGMNLEGQPVVLGQRHRRRRWVVVGAVLVSAGMFTVIRPLIGRHISGYLPLRVLSWMSAQGDLGVMAEITGRIRSGALDADDHRRLAERALRIQVDDSAQKHARYDWIELLETMDVSALLTKEEREQYYDQCVRNLVVGAPQTMMSTQLLSFDITFDGATAAGGLHLRVARPLILIDGDVVDEEAIDINPGSHVGVSRENASITVDNPLTTGKRHVEFSGQLNLCRGKVVIRSWKLEHVVDIVVEDHAWSRLAEESEEIDKALGEALRPNVSEPDATTNRGRRRHDRNRVFFFVWPELPVTIAFDIFVMTKDGEVHIGAISGRKGDRKVDRTWMRDAESSFAIQEVDVVLRPSLEIARRKGYAEIYPKELRFPKLRLGRRD